MKKFKFICVLMSAFSLLHGQLDDPALNIIRVDGQKAKAMQFHSVPVEPTDPDFKIMDDKLMVKIWEGFKFWDEMYEGYKKSLIIFPSEKNASVSDSVLIVENESNKFSFVNTESGWTANHIIIKDEHVTLNYIRVGLTSKELFKLLKKKIDKPVGDGTVCLQNSDGSHKLILEFAQDKIVEMKF